MKLYLSILIASYRQLIRVVTFTLALFILFNHQLSYALTKDGLDLSVDQLRWLEDNPKIRFAFDPAFAPVEFLTDDDSYRGMSADYIEILENLLEVKFVIVKTSSWDEALELARNGLVDVLSAVARTKQRDEYLIFTEPYLKLPAVVIAGDDVVEGVEIEKLMNRKIAVVSGYAWADWIMTLYPQTPLLIVPDIMSGLESVSFGVADAMIGDLATTSYSIGQSGISNLRVVRQIDQSLDLSIGVRAGLPVLRDILDLALNAIGDEQKKSIISSWIHLEPYTWWKNPTLYWWASAIIVLFLMVITLIMVWNRILNRQVEMRTNELRAAQDRLLQAAKLESVGQLAAGVAHEVKNPLTILQAGLDYFYPVLKENDGSKEVFNDMQDAIDRGSWVINELLDFSHEKKVELQAVKINDVVRRSIRLVGHEFSKYQIDVTERLDEKIPDILGDADKLQQVLINLFMNAIHAMQNKGTITIQTALVDSNQSNLFAVTKTNNKSHRKKYVSVIVEDTGPGIPDDVMEKIFDPFFTTKPVGQGTGLGLSIIHSIIELHDAEITISNRENGGARIALFFESIGDKA